MLPDLYFDHNVSRRLADRLSNRGYVVSTARVLGLERATDAKHLLTAAERGWLLLTHNERDFKLLFDAWRRWTDAWGVAPVHGGIVVLPQWEPPIAEAALLPLLVTGVGFANSLRLWVPPAGWRAMEYLP